MQSNDCPMTEDVPKSVDENSVLLRDKRLIVLREALWYCEDNNVKEIQYSELKRLCDESLELITDKKQTDMGGSFNVILTRLEGIHDVKKRYLRRDKRSSKRSSIIPDIAKIRMLLESKALIELKKDEYSSLPPMEKPIVETTPTLVGYSTISDPSDKIKVYRDWKKSRRATIAYGSTFWKISVMHPKKRVLKLSDVNIEDLLEFGKKLPLRMTLDLFR